jgi:hypothetical protein
VLGEGRRLRDGATAHRGKHRGGPAVRRNVRPVGPAHDAAQNPRGLGARDVGKARGGLGKARVGLDAEAASGQRHDARDAAGALAGVTSRRGVVPSANVWT